MTRLFTLDPSPYASFMRHLSNAIYVRHPKPIIYISADSTNAGDYASALGVRSLFDMPGAIQYCSKRALRQLSLYIAILKLLGHTPTLVIGGGGLLQPVFERFWKLLLHLRVPYILYGVGLNTQGTVRPPMDQRLLSDLSRSALYIRVRDNTTAAAISEAFRCEVSVGICPATHWIYNHSAATQSSPRTLLHVIHPQDLAIAGSDPTDISRHLRNVAFELRLDYDETSHINENIIRLIERYRSAAIVVTSRLHGAIFSLSLNIPFLAFDCDSKIKSFIDTFSLNAPLLSPSPLFPNDLSGQIRSTMEQASINNKEILRNQIKCNIDSVHSLKSHFSVFQP